MNGDLKLTFIQKSMTEYMAIVKRNMIVAADKLKAVKSGAGKASINSVTQTAGQSVTGKLTFKEYLRFVDMGVGRGHPLGGLMSVRVELASRKGGGNKLVADRTFKPKKIYATVAYSQLTPLYNRLIYGFTEETIEMLKNEIQSENANNILTQ